MSGEGGALYRIYGDRDVPHVSPNPNPILEQSHFPVRFHTNTLTQSHTRFQTWSVFLTDPVKAFEVKDCADVQ